jgi:predicted ATPase
MLLRGWALTEQGQGEEGLAEMRQGLNDVRSTGAEARLPSYLALLAKACEQAGQVEEGLTRLAEALAQAQKKGECWHVAELYRLQGELLQNAECGMQNAGWTAEERVAGKSVRKYTLSSNPFQFNRVQGNYAKFSTRCCGIPWG